tara:strand:+ start:734 stop:1384 length:651 start_codon:yes stop_codon:yes gene_type:complete
MKIVATSDLHGSYPEIPECDTLIIAGDICHEGDPRNHRLIKSKYKLINKFIPWLNSVPAEDIVFIAGNHDYIFEEGRHMLPKWPSNCHYLEDSGVEIDGIKFWGTPYVPNLPYWAFHNRDEMVSMHRFSQIPSDTDILISHGPAFGILDKVYRGGFNVGCNILAEVVKTVDPEYFICGHIHEGYGQVNIGNTKYINCSFNTVNYEPINPVFEFDIE